MIQAIVIGHSAGGLQPAITILKQVPTGMPPVILVCHQPCNSAISSVIRREVALPVLDAYDKQKLAHGNIYVAPSGYHLLMETSEQLSISLDMPECYVRPSVDVLFETATDATDGHLVGLILSGANHDGSKGLKYIQDHGGLTMVQDPSSAKFATMPEASLALSTPDIVGTADQLANKLVDWLTR
ncbi:chemotaxis protein CheB [Salinibius halmophilus]|uniref:chemotaxis protein CheB n=1 Tax=Salinibius halmophilus TaxID=1853216 RepID=UPI000E66F38C|nr:chemotaxis protein CheB [Salinibius halmophilus]